MLMVAEQAPEDLEWTKTIEQEKEETAERKENEKKKEREMKKGGLKSRTRTHNSTDRADV